MKNCTDCKHAEWARTKSGRLHPSGEGVCTYKWSAPELPAAMYWSGDKAPIPFGGVISRKKELKKHCVYWVRESSDDRQ